MSKSIADIKANIVEVGCAMLAKGLVTGTWGNISALLPNGFVAITPSGGDYRLLTPADIVTVSSCGITDEENLIPSSELPLHLAIYAARKDVGAIVHTHSVFASACAVARCSIPPIIEDLIQVVGGEVAVAEYALPGTKELAGNTVAALGDRQAVLMANHGVVACGKTLSQAMLVAELAEKAAQIYIYAKMLGGPQLLSEKDVTVMRQFYLDCYQKRQGGSE
ncbi:MAG: L-fuculose-phosphate aldolase [Firmicutes bacterium]|nr:L-fuculose-phosphate aldolase [Bacillota bacterium]